MPAEIGRTTGPFKALMRPKDCSLMPTTAVKRHASVMRRCMAREPAARAAHVLKSGAEHSLLSCEG